MPISHVSTEGQQISDSIFEDYTLPAVDDVQAEFERKATDIAGAAEFLAELDIDAAAVSQAVDKIALINYTITWNPAAGRYRFCTFPAGCRQRTALAVPVLEAGRFVDLFLIGVHSHEVTTVCGRTRWLGRDNPRSQSSADQAVP